MKKSIAIIALLLISICGVRANNTVNNTLSDKDMSVQEPTNLNTSPNTAECCKTDTRTFCAGGSDITVTHTACAPTCAGARIISYNMVEMQMKTIKQLY
jgi:hypothetical protein